MAQLRAKARGLKLSSSAPQILSSLRNRGALTPSRPQLISCPIPRRPNPIAPQPLSSSALSPRSLPKPDGDASSLTAQSLSLSDPKHLSPSAPQPLGSLALTSHALSSILLGHRPSTPQPLISSASQPLRSSILSSFDPKNRTSCDIICLPRSRALNRSLFVRRFSAAPEATGSEKKKQSWIAGKWKHFVDELKNYWLGTKLLGAEVGICYGIVNQLLRGEELSRREYRQLRRTSADLLKMVPMAIMILVPFMEVALPAVLWLFPGILPSTFQQEWKREDNLKRQLKARIEVARFLQDAVDQMALQLKKRSSDPNGEEAVMLSEFMEQVQRGEAFVTNENILKFSKLFNDDITLDNVGRMQLVNLCKLLDIPAFGSDSFLKFQLQQRMLAIKNDDKMIAAEGVESLTVQELREALAYRGMRASGLTKSRYKRDLEGWLDLSLRKSVPTSLLLMSRAFKLTQQVSEEDALKETLQAMPLQAFKSASAEANDPDKIKEKQRKLEILEREQELIEIERKEKESLVLAELEASAGRYIESTAREWLSYRINDIPAENESSAGADGLVVLRQKFDLLEDELLQMMRTTLQQKFSKLDLKDAKHSEILKHAIAERKDKILNLLLAAPQPPAAPSAEPTPQPADPEGVNFEKKADPAKVETTEVKPEKKETEKEKQGEAISSIDEVPPDVKLLAEISDLVLLLGGKNATAEEIEMLKQIKSERKVLDQDLIKIEEENESIGKGRLAKAAKTLGTRVESMISRLEKDVEEASGVIGDKFRLIDKDGDGVFSEEELRDAFKKVLNRNLESGQLEAIIKELDVTRDGFIDMTDVEHVAHTLARKRYQLLTDKEGLGDEGNLSKPEILTKSTEELSDDEAVLWGCLLAEYRDKISEYKALLAADRRIEEDIAKAERAVKMKAQQGAAGAEEPKAQSRS